MMKIKSWQWLLLVSLVPLSSCLLIKFDIRLSGMMQYAVAGCNLACVGIAMLGSGWQVFCRHQKGGYLVSLALSFGIAFLSSLSAIAGIVSTLF